MLCNTCQLLDLDQICGLAWGEGGQAGYILLDIYKPELWAVKRIGPWEVRNNLSSSREDHQAAANNFRLQLEKSKVA